MSAAGSTVGDANDIVEIRLRGRYYAEPATVQITVAVEPDAVNRTLRVEADSERMFRSSEITLAGAGEKRIHTLEFKNLPAGEYTLSAQVFSDRNARRRDAAAHGQRRRTDDQADDATVGRGVIWDGRSPGPVTREHSRRRPPTA